MRGDDEIVPIAAGQAEGRLLLRGRSDDQGPGWPDRRMRSSFDPALSGTVLAAVRCASIRSTRAVLLAVVRGHRVFTQRLAVAVTAAGEGGASIRVARDIRVDHGGGCGWDDDENGAVVGVGRWSPKARLTGYADASHGLHGEFEQCSTTTCWTFSRIDGCEA
ncbi:hypothetical protein OG203_36785 [Nocardia sp. NBC_01499]|uniref:hypothetical protein n=1 Tax=Nocardia sp. NBC_01499 TaxID=2903597 RepID=UPI00387032BC